MLGKQIPAPVQDVALLVGRVLLGVIFIAHGWQKFHEFGLEGTGQAFAGMGVPAPEVAAAFAATVELVGGVLLLVGLLTPVAAGLLALDMLGAFWLVHRGAGVFVTENGWELVAALGAGALVIGAVGAGRLALDPAFGALLRRARATGHTDEVPASR